MEEKHVGAFQDDTGSVSLGRILSFIAICFSGILIFSGIVLIFIETLGHFGTSNGIALSGLGAGIGTGGLGLKGWQKTSEAKMYGNNNGTPYSQEINSGTNQVPGK